MDDIDKALKGIDLTGVAKDIQNDLQQNQQSQQNQQQQQVQEPVKQDLAQFKSPEDLLKGYKELQGFTTKTTQENKALKAELEQLREQVQLQSMAQFAPQYQQQVQQQQNGQDDIEARINRAVAVQTIAGVLQEEAQNDSMGFQERYAYAQAVSRQYPHLATTPFGVKKLFELGDKLRKDNITKNAGRALESIFGEPLNEQEIARLKTLVKGDKAISQQQQFNANAYMPDTSTSTQSGQNQNQKPNLDRQLKESVEKGDVDGTIDFLFRKALAE